MQDHLKERLTGAAILVLIVVLLVPEMFRGRPAGGVDRDGATPEGAPIRTVTIDLRDSTAVQPPSAATPVAAMPAASSPATAPPPAAAAVPALAAVAPPPKTAPAVQHASGAASGWTVQVGTFTRREFAERMVRQLRGKGFAVEAVGPDDRGLYRVRSRLLPERAAALALKQKMQGRGLKPIVNAVP